jgi:hypothetical protein
MVRCAKCGHSWHQPGEERPEFVPEIPSEPPAQPAAEAGEAAAQQQGFTSPARAFAPQASVHANAPSAAEEKRPWGPRLAVAAGWAGLIAAVLLIVLAAVRYRQDIATVWPQSAGVYSSLGLKVNAGGIDFRGVEYRRGQEDGQTVLAVSGAIVNGGTRALPVPQTVRVTLSDAGNRELYHWTFRPPALMLKPGQSVPFTTRLSSPPAATRHLEVRFAKDGS